MALRAIKRDKDGWSVVVPDDYIIIKGASSRPTIINVNKILYRHGYEKVFRLLYKHRIKTSLHECVEEVNRYFLDVVERITDESDVITVTSTKHVLSLCAHTEHIFKEALCYEERKWSTQPLATQVYAPVHRLLFNTGNPIYIRNGVFVNWNVQNGES